MKKFLSILLLVAMIMSLMIVSAYATEENGDEIIDIPIDGGEGDPGTVPPATTAHTHCVCGGSAVGVKDHVCDESAEWTAISGNVDFGTLASGNYYLEGDVTVSTCTAIQQDVQLNICLNGNDIVAGMGVIENDFHDRKDLSPNVCAVYTEETHRCRGIAGQLLNMVVEDMRAKGISPIYLVTDHTGFYERYGWEFLCMVQGDGEEEMTRMYIHH